MAMQTIVERSTLFRSFSSTAFSNFDHSAKLCLFYHFPSARSYKLHIRCCGGYRCYILRENGKVLIAKLISTLTVNAAHLPCIRYNNSTYRVPQNTIVLRFKRFSAKEISRGPCSPRSRDLSKLSFLSWPELLKPF